MNTNSQKVLHLKINSGKLKAAMVSGILVVSENDLLSELPKLERPEYKKHAHLSGHGIGIREAGRKYGIPNPSIVRWVKRGLIAIIGKEGSQKVLIDEADIAYCAEIYHQDSGQGRWLFNDDGTPYRKIT